jgi:hypothetical protein
VKVGDIARCGSEFGIILSISRSLVASNMVQKWCEVLWQNGEIEGIDIDDISEIINESR